MNANTAFDNDPVPMGIADSRGSMESAGDSVAFALGDGDRIFKASEAFLKLVGYSIKDLLDGHLGWQDLAPPKSPRGEITELCPGSSVVDVAPFTKELVRKDGERILGKISAVILNRVPFRWFATVHPLPPADLRLLKGQPIRLVTPEFEEFVGSCPAMQRVMELVRQVAPTDATTLILGETGTGKELVARAVHKLSRRRDSPFVTLNCAALPAGTLESELFGHERGAFTGAHTQRLGRFELANNGTLFLDEVGDLPVELQPKLLRALQEGTIERLGGTKTIPVNVRVIAATNRDLTAMMAKQMFRSELFYRLNVFPITTPALRERGKDLSLLIQHFTQHYAQQLNKTIVRIPNTTMSAMMAWQWPGNIRELENFILRSVILTRGTVLEAPVEELPQNGVAVIETLDEMKRQRILTVLKDCNGVIKVAAGRLGMCRTTLNALMGRLEIHRRDFM